MSPRVKANVIRCCLLAVAIHLAVCQLHGIHWVTTGKMQIYMHTYGVPFAYAECFVSTLIDQLWLHRNIRWFRVALVLDIAICLLLLAAMQRQLLHLATGFKQGPRFNVRGLLISVALFAVLCAVGVPWLRENIPPSYSPRGLYNADDVPLVDIPLNSHFFSTDLGKFFFVPVYVYLLAAAVTIVELLSRTKAN